MLSRVSTIVLDTADITGDINTNHTKFTFRNIDFDIVLGDEWREFDQFNLTLVSAIADKQDKIPKTQVPEVRMTGPPFADPDIRVNTTKNEVSVCTMDLSSITQRPTIQNFTGLHTWTLKRDDENLFNFTFHLVDPKTDSTASGSFPRQMYVFKLYKI